MRYHNITKDDMLNGCGLRVVLWLAGCEHHCKGCQNPITWNPDGGQLFTAKEIDEIFAELEKDHVSGITFSGGDPLHPLNRHMVYNIAKIAQQAHPEKTVWMYTGYTWEDILENEELLAIMEVVDVLVDGKFEESLLDKNAKWVGSTNQRVIDVTKSLKRGGVVLYESN